MRGGARWQIWLWLLFAGCGEPAGRESLRLLEFRQQDVATVALNEELALFFSAPLDASSITSDSVRVLDEDGLEARGERRVRGHTLTFLPDLPRAPDLSDGGFRPGRRYRVVLGGFPRPDGIRSTRGAVFSSGLVLSFATASPGGTSPLFLGPFLGVSRLQPRGKPGPGHEVELEDGRLVLEYGEALDPSCVPACRFLLSRSTPGAPELATTARLIENRRDHAALELALVDPGGTSDGRFPGGSYFLTLPGPQLLTLGQRIVEPGLPYFVLNVPPERVSVDLAGGRELAPERPPGCDGTARWDEERGALRLRFPAAAGNGTDGDAGAEALRGARDLHATRIEVPEGSTVDLGERVGPVVLRSQTSFHVRGEIVRRGGTQKPTPLAGKTDPLTEELASMARNEPRNRDPLAPWIERVLTPDQAWSGEPLTILVAGGDLWIPKGGALEVEGNLVLVAGGEIRVDGRAFAHGNLWRTGGGGNLASAGWNKILPLELDEPRVNPLRTPLVFGALTGPLPGSARAVSSTWLVGHEGLGRLSATLVEEPPRGGTVSGSVRFLLRLSVEPGEGEPWDPPRLERLEVQGLGLAPSGRPERP